MPKYRFPVRRSGWELMEQNKTNGALELHLRHLKRGDRVFTLTPPAESFNCCYCQPGQPSAIYRRRLLVYCRDF
ncbi:hypothetical protein J6590_016327 [Homalodisca vitripennis]|nr:hypothetical protein J6590_016327 [Homalodisca vitripennis]